MSFRVRLAVAAAVAVAVAVALAAVIAYAVVRSQLRSEVDDSLTARVDQVRHVPINVEGSPGRFFLRIPGPALGEAGGYVQVVSADGTALRPEGAETPLPVSERVRSVAGGKDNGYLSDDHVAGTHVRVLTAPLVFPDVR